MIIHLMHAKVLIMNPKKFPRSDNPFVFPPNYQEAKDLAYYCYCHVYYYYYYSHVILTPLTQDQTFETLRIVVAHHLVGGKLFFLPSRSQVAKGRQKTTFACYIQISPKVLIRFPSNSYTMQPQKIGSEDVYLGNSSSNT